MPSPSPTRTLAPRPPRTTRPTRTKRNLLTVTSLGLAGLLAGLLSGCSAGTSSATASSANSFAQVSGNWQFSSSATTAARLSSLGGSLTVSAEGGTVTGILHPLSTSGPCIPTSTAIPVTGSIDAASRLTLTAPVSGGTLYLSGTLSADHKSLIAPNYAVTGGSCAFPAAQTASARDTTSPVVAQQYQPVSGAYAGTLTTSEGETFSLTTTLTQTSQPDESGVYHVSGSAASPGNTCVPASLPATASTIDGGSISTTWIDAVTGASITGAGSTSPDGATITIAHWTINSLCGTDTGTGTLTRH